MLKHIPASPLGGPLGGHLGGPLGGHVPLGGPLGSPLGAHLGHLSPLAPLGGVPGGAGHHHHGAHGALRGNPLSSQSLSLPLSPRTLSPRTPSLSRSLHSHLSTASAASGSPAGTAGPSPAGTAGPSPSGGNHSPSHALVHGVHHGQALAARAAHGPARAQPVANGGLHISRISTITTPGGGAQPPTPPGAASPAARPTAWAEVLGGLCGAVGSLGVVCFLALLLALCALLALLALAGPPPLDLTAPDEYVLVHEVALALCALTLSLDLSCLLVCAVQLLFAVKLARSPNASSRTDKYLRKSSITRVCAMGGFFISIPVFLTGIILYLFIQFHSTPAIVTSVLIGVGIVFSGCAMVHNVFIWQKEKTNAVRHIGRQQQEQHRQHLHQHSHHLNSTHWMNDISKHTGNGSLIPGVPPATLDLSSLTTTPHELSTLV